MFALFVMFQEFYERGILNSSLMKTFVCLISKETVTKVKEFCPISLVTSV